MRKYKNELLFIIVNFDSQLVDVAINVPSHAFEFLTDTTNGKIIRLQTY